MERDEILNLTSAAWKEKVYIETSEYIIRGYVYLPKVGKRTRMLSDILSAKKQFIAVKDCTIESKLNSQKEIEQHDFIQVNLLSIILMRPLNEN